MTTNHNDDTPVAVITGFGEGLGSALAKRLVDEGHTVIGISRSGILPRERYEGFYAKKCDVSQPASVADAFKQIKSDYGAPRILIHNAAMLKIGDFLQTDPKEFEQLWRTTCFGAMLCVREVLPDMLGAGTGTIILSGATASVKGGANFSAFASAKFALRGLTQSLARAYGPRGIHVVHTVVDGVIWGDRAEKRFGMEREKCMEPNEIADTYLHLIGQRSSSWTQEIDLRPSLETF